MSCAADAIVVQVGAKNQMRRSLARLCARMRRILLTTRGNDDFTRRTSFPFVKWICFETASDVLKSMILQS